MQLALYYGIKNHFQHEKLPKDILPTFLVGTLLFLLSQLYITQSCNSSVLFVMPI